MSSESNPKDDEETFAFVETGKCVLRRQMIH